MYVCGCVYELSSVLQTRGNQRLVSCSRMGLLIIRIQYVITETLDKTDSICFKHKRYLYNYKHNIKTSVSLAAIIQILARNVSPPLPCPGFVYSKW